MLCQLWTVNPVSTGTASIVAVSLELGQGLTEPSWDE